MPQKISVIITYPWLATLLAPRCVLMNYGLATIFNLIKVAMLKIRSTSVTFLSLCNLEAAPEEAMQLRRLIKSSNESLGPYLFGKIEFWNF